MTAGEMEEKYYRPDERSLEMRLDLASVPEGLRSVIPLAKKWGISDDMLRRREKTRASQEELTELTRIVVAHDDQLDRWLAGPAADHVLLTAEYLAFANMRMAADGC